MRQGKNGRAIHDQCLTAYSDFSSTFRMASSRRSYVCPSRPKLERRRLVLLQGDVEAVLGRRARRRRCRRPCRVLGDARRRRACPARRCPGRRRTGVVVVGKDRHRLDVLAQLRIALEADREVHPAGDQVRRRPRRRRSDGWLSPWCRRCRSAAVGAGLVDRRRWSSLSSIVAVVVGHVDGAGRERRRSSPAGRRGGSVDPAASWRRRRGGRVSPRRRQPN